MTAMCEHCGIDEPVCAEGWCKYCREALQPAFFGRVARIDADMADEIEQAVLAVGDFHVGFLSVPSVDGARMFAAALRAAGDRVDAAVNLKLGSISSRAAA